MTIIKNITRLLFLGIFCGMIGCSEELVEIRVENRSELDSLKVVIAVTTEDITAAQIAENALKAKLDSLEDALAELEGFVPSTTLKPDVHYTVQITDGSQTYINAKTASLPDAVVTISQGNTTQEITTDVSGFATFPELESGFISVTVEIAGFSDVYAIVDLRDSGTDSDGTNAENRYASSQIVVFPTTGSSMFTISGTSYYNQDLDNLRAGTESDPFHPRTGDAIYETLPADISFTIDCTPTSIPNNSTRSGKIIQIVYAGLSRVATTDASGNWSIQIPVVFLSNGTNFLSYSGPNVQSNFSATQVSSTSSALYIWGPVGSFYPTIFSEILLFPGGSTIQDLYYEPI